jgi:hypothetical protein
MKKRNPRWPRRRKPRVAEERPDLAPMDARTRAIQRALDLIKPFDYEYGYDGYCGAATEAYLHLSGGRHADLRVKRADNSDGSSHWWLVGSRGVIDVTVSPQDRRDLRAHPHHGYPYEDGRGAMFRTGYERPSRRAQVIIDIVNQEVADS